MGCTFNEIQGNEICLSGVACIVVGTFVKSRIVHCCFCVNLYSKEFK